jgi:Tfp pilus assembly protein PilN
MIKINLLPTEIKKQEIAEKQNAGFLIVCIVIFVILGIIIFVLYAYDKTLTFEITSKTENIITAKKSLETYHDLNNEVFFIKDRITEFNNQKSAPGWAKMLSSMSNATPRTVTLNSFDAVVSQNPQIEIKGNATNYSDVVKFKENLNASKYFSDVTFQSSLKSITNEIETIDFSLKANIKGNDEQ